MRSLFAKLLLDEMRENKDIYLLTGDLGYKIFDMHLLEFPERTINVGAAEYSMINLAIGLSHSGKIPFCYSITPFLIYRPFETLRTYVNHENIPIKLVGSGRDDDYKHDGFSHDASDVKTVLNTLPRIKQFYPEDEDGVKEYFKEIIKNDSPSFISLKR